MAQLEEKVRSLAEEVGPLLVPAASGARSTQERRQACRGRGNPSRGKGAR